MVALVETMSSVLPLLELQTAVALVWGSPNPIAVVLVFRLHCDVQRGAKSDPVHQRKASVLGFDPL